MPPGDAVPPFDPSDQSAASSGPADGVPATPGGETIPPDEDFVIYDESGAEEAPGGEAAAAPEPEPVEQAPAHPPQRRSSARVPVPLTTRQNLASMSARRMTQRVPAEPAAGAAPAPVRATTRHQPFHPPPAPTNVPPHPPPKKREPSWRMVAGAAALGLVAGILLLAGTPFRGTFGLVRKAEADRRLDRVLKVERAETAEMLGKRYVLDFEEEMRKFRAGKAVPPPERRRPDDLAAEAARLDERNPAP